MSDKTIKNKSVQFRVTALAVLVCFITTSVSLPVSADASSAGPAVPTLLPFAELTIPDELGTMTKAVGAQSVAAGDPGKTSVQDSSQRTVILIQDAHAVNDAQNKIQQIIAHLQTHHYADVLLVEGAQGRLDPTILRNYPDKNVKQRVINEYLERAELAGVESAAVLNDTLGRFEGAEDWALYSENFDAYQRAQAEKESLLDVLSGYEHKLEMENTGRINSRLEDFLKQWTGFRSGSVSFHDMLISLQEFSSLAKEGDGFSELKRILDALGYEKSSQPTALEPAVKKMAAEFKQKFANVMDVRDQANFYMNYQKFLTGQLGAGEMLSHLLRLGRKLGKEPRLSPEMRRLLGHTQTLAAIKGNRLFEELNRFLVMVAMSLAQNSDDVSTVERYEKLFILEDLVKLELTHHSISSLMKSGAHSTKVETSSRAPDLQAPDKIKVLNLDDFDLGFLSDFGLSVSDFEKRLQPAIDFYRAALERDRVFYERIKAVPESDRTIVLIAGGFHTSGIERLLRENQDSYAVVTPRIESLKGSENYFRVMNNDFSYQKYLGTTYYDGLIRHAIRKLTEGLGEAELRQTAKRWRDNLIRDLASQNRITDFGQYSHYLDDLNQVYAERFAKDLKPLTKEDILEVIKKELEKFKSDVLVSLRRQVEGDLQSTTAGIQGLEDQKESSGTKPSDLALDIPVSKPSMLSAALALAPRVPILKLPLSEVRQPTVVASDIPEALREPVSLEASGIEIGPGVGEEGSGRSETRVNDAVKEKIESIRAGLHQLLRWLVAKMAVGPWREKMLGFLLESDHVKILIDDGKKHQLKRYVAKYEPKTGRVYLSQVFPGHYSKESLLSHLPGAAQPEIYKGKGVELILGDDGRPYLSVKFDQPVLIVDSDQKILQSENIKPLLVPLPKVSETIAFLKKTVPGFSRWQKARVKALEQQKLEAARLWFNAGRFMARESKAFDKDGDVDTLEYGSSRFEVGISDSGEEIVVRVFNRDTGILDGILFYPFLVGAWFTAGQGYANEIPVLDPGLPPMALRFSLGDKGVYVSSVAEISVYLQADGVRSEELIPSFEEAVAKNPDYPGVLLPHTAGKIEKLKLFPLEQSPDMIGPPFHVNPEGPNAPYILRARAEVRSEDGRRPAGMISNVRKILMAGILSIAMMSSAIAMSPRSFGAFQGGLQTLGWYTGKVDRKDGPRTQSAVRTLQTILRDELGFTGIRVNGRYDDPATLAAVKELQRKFQELWTAKYRGGVDGVLGPATAPFFKRYLELLRKGREAQGLVGQGLSDSVVLPSYFLSDPATEVLNNPTLQAGFSGLGFQVIQRLLVSRQLVPKTQETRNFIYTYLYETHQIVQTAKQTLTDSEFQRVFHSKKSEMTLERVAQLAMFVFDLNNHESMGHVHIKNKRGSDFSQAQIVIGTRKELFQKNLFKKIAGVTETQPATSKEWEEFLVTGSSANRNRIAMVIIHFLRAPRGLSFEKLFPIDTVEGSKIWGKYYQTQSLEKAMRNFSERAKRFRDDWGQVTQYYLSHQRSEVRAEGSLPDDVRDSMLPEKLPNVVILSPVFNERDKLPEVLENIKQQKYLKNVIFVDDGSSDTTATFLRDSGVYFISFAKNAQKEGALLNALEILQNRYGLPDYFVAIDGDSYFGGENILAVLKKAIKEMEKGGNVARPIDIEAHLTARSGALEWLQGIHWYLTMGIRTIYSKISFFPPSLLGGGNIFKTQVFLDAVAKRKAGFEAGDVELNGIISSMGKVAKPLSTVRVRTEVFKKWNDFFKQQRRWARAQLEGTPNWFFAVFLSGLVLFDAFILWNLPAFLALTAVLAVASVFSVMLRYGVMQFQKFASAGSKRNLPEQQSIRVRFWRDVVLLSPLLALYETVNMFTMFNVATFQQLQAPKSIPPWTDTTATRSEIRSDEIDPNPNDYGLRRGRLSRDSEIMLGSLADYLSRNQIARDDANLIARTLVRMKPLSLELLRDWGVLTAEETRLVAAGDIGKIMISQDMSNSLAQRMRRLLESYDQREFYDQRRYTRAQKDVLLSRLIPVDQIDAILARSPDLNDGVVIEMLDSRFSLILQMDRAIEIAASLRELGIVSSLAWRILIKQGTDRALSWASDAQAVVERIKDAQGVNGQRNAWLMIMNHGIEKVEEAERRGTLPKLMNAWDTRSELRDNDIPEGLKEEIQRAYGRAGGPEIFAEHLSMENIIHQVLEDFGKDNNVKLVEGKDFELFWYRQRFGIIMKNAESNKYNTDEVKAEIIERLKSYYHKYKPKINVNVEPLDDGVEVSYRITPASLTEFGKFFGTADIQYYDEGHRFPRPFTPEEIREKFVHKAEMFLRGMELYELPPDAIEKFKKWALGVVASALANSDRYGRKEIIRTESIKRSVRERHEDGYRYTTLNAMRKNAEGSVLFDFLLRELRRRENAKRVVYLARGAGSLKKVARYANWLFSPEIVQGARENFLFMLSQDTEWDVIRDIKDLFRFSPETYLPGEGGDPDEFVESVSYDVLERQAMEILEDLDNGKSRLMHGPGLGAREIKPHGEDGKGPNRFAQFFDRIYDWVKEAGIVDGLQPGETILVVDESSSGTYPWILKYVIETRYRAELAKRLGKPVSEIKLQVIFWAGGRSNNDYGIVGFPMFYPNDYKKTFGFGDFASHAISVAGENMPHPVKVGRYSKGDADEGEYEVEETDVLLGAYLNSMFIYNEVVKFYSELNGIVLKKDKTEQEWNLVLHYLALKLPPEVEVTPAALARASGFALTADDIQKELSRSETRGSVPLKDGFEKFVERVDVIRREWDTSVKKADEGKQGAKESFASEAVVSLGALKSGHLCLVRGNFDKLTQGLRTALDAVRDEFPVFKSGDETDPLSGELKMLTELVRNISQHVQSKEGIVAIQFDKEAKRLYVAAIDRGAGFSFRTQGAEEASGIAIRDAGHFVQSGINRVGEGIGMRAVVRQCEHVLIRSGDKEWSDEDLKSQGVIPGVERKDGLPGSLVSVSVNLEESMQIINNAIKIRMIDKKLKDLANAVGNFSRFSDLRWEFASEIPWPELVRVTSPEEQYRPRNGVDRTYGTQENRWNYWSNQIDVRYAFLHLIGNALEQKRPLTIKEVEKYLRTAHHRLIFGVNDQSPYYSPTLLSMGFPNPEVALRAGTGKLYLTKEGITGYTQKLNVLLERLARPKLTVEDIIQPLFDLHRAIIVPEVPRESKGAFAFPFANNSFSMNQINAVRRLLGHAGISHDGIDFALLQNRKDVTRALKYFTALMRGESYPSDENAFAPTVAGSAQAPSDVRRAEIRESPGFEPLELEGELEGQLKDRGFALLAELEKRPELRDYVLGSEFEELVKKLLGIFGDVAVFVKGVREAMIPKILAAETVDLELASILPDAMSALTATLKQVKGNVTIAVGDMLDVMDQFIEIPSEYTSQVNEIGVTGMLHPKVRTLLRERGVTIRSVKPKWNFISRNQSQVPYVTDTNSLVEMLAGVFDPILADQVETGDVSVQRYRDRFLIVAAIHLADIRRIGKAMSQSEILDELLRRLNLKEQEAMIEIRGGRFVVSSTAIQLYLKMQAEKSIQRAA